MGNSSSTPSSTTTTNGEQYDVFISFRGEDTRNGFTSHLYQALHEKQIKTFIDNQLIRGDEISEGLSSVIRESKISVIIFSENYASSKWCLRELAEIMKYREMNNQIVIPVFYKVDPSHVRKQIGSYEAAFAKHENELQQGEVKKWRQALTEASNISGFDSSIARNEAEFVCDIVKDVWNKSNNIWSSCDFKDLVGIDKRIERVVSLLCLGVPDFRIIGIWGMGGMGKTTIADAVFHLVSHQFEKTYFAPCVRAESEKDSSGLIHLRDDIISKVLNEENLKIGSPSIPQLIKRRLNQKKVLIVLDDVDKFTILEDLARGLDRFGPESRIILTTRDKQVLRNCGVEDHNMYEVEELNCDEALQLFCNYAFKQDHPTKDFEFLTRELVKFAKNLPLAVKLLGLSMYTKSKQDWENAVEIFKSNVNPGVLDLLKISYDGLNDEEKGLFLDIACFDEIRFKIDEEDPYFAPSLLSDRKFYLSNLIDKSLVTVEHGSIKIHDLLREMGREIVHKESPNKPGDRSRLWRQEDVLHTLKHNHGTEAVQGIFLNMSKLKDVYLSFQALMKMYNLRTLIITYSEVHLRNSGLDYLPDKLRYLHWEKYPLEELPSSFNPENLVELDLSHSKIKQLWEVSTCVPKLKWLNLHYCKNLISIPDLSNIPSAEIINLKYCRSLVEIHSSRECPKNLHSLQLKGCENLNRLPHISGNIKRLDLRWSGVEEVPSTIQSLSKLENLDMSYCTRLKRISKSICKLKSLDRLDLSRCCKLESFPDILEGMELKYLNLSKTAIKELHPSIGNLNRLEELVLSGGENLEKLPSRSKLEKLPPLSGLCSLKKLRLNKCNLTEISEDIGCLSSLEELELEENDFERLPKSIKKLSKLYYLSLSNCGMLRSLPELPSSVRYLVARNCKQLIHSLPDESEFELCPDGSGSFYFNFMNCLKLNQKAVNNLLIFFRDSLQKMQGMGTEKIISLVKVSHEVTSQLPPYLGRLLKTPDEEVKGSICLPGSEILECFTLISPLKVRRPPFPPSLRLQQTPDEKVKGSICLPGSEIPEWFSCYKNIGSSIYIPRLRNDCDRSSYIMGFAVCLVFGVDSDIRFLGFNGVRYDFHIDTIDGHKEEFFQESILEFGESVQGRVLISSDHILLGYNLSRKCYEFFQELDTRLANYGRSGYLGTSFNIRSNQVKYCGIQPIYVKAQVMNSVSINQDTGDTSGCNDSDEETCEPHPKRICTEENQFS